MDYIECFENVETLLHIKTMKNKLGKIDEPLTFKTRKIEKNIPLGINGQSEVIFHMNSSLKKIFL